MAVAFCRIRREISRCCAIVRASSTQAPLAWHCGSLYVSSLRYPVALAAPAEDDSTRSFRIKEDRSLTKNCTSSTHMLLTLKVDSKLTSAAEVDSIISGEVPDPIREPVLYKLSLSPWFIDHAGIEIPIHRLPMQNDQHSKRNPKEFRDEASLSVDGNRNRHSVNLNNFCWQRIGRNAGECCPRPCCY